MLLTAEIYGEYLPIIRNIARSVYRRVPPWVCDVEDLEQLGSLGLLVALGKAGRPETFKGYAILKIRGYMLDWLRTERHKRPVVPLSLADYDAPIMQVQDLDHSVLMLEFGVAVSKLTPDRQKIIAGTMEGRTLRDIAVDLGLSCHEVSWLRTLAIGELRRWLKGNICLHHNN